MSPSRSPILRDLWTSATTEQRFSQNQVVERCLEAYLELDSRTHRCDGLQRLAA
jgi:hypothetical protein